VICVAARRWARIDTVRFNTLAPRDFGNGPL